MNWNLLPAISAPMSFQMALDERLFQKAKENPAELPHEEWREIAGALLG